MEQGYYKIWCFFLFFSVTIKTEPTDDHPKIVDSHTIKEPPLKMIKLETKDTSIDDRPNNVPPLQPLLERSLNATSPAEMIVNRTPPISNSPLSAVTDQPKYCNICDIKFNYLNTFIAHKKFYCKNSDVEMVDSTPVLSTTPTNNSSTSVARGTETPVL